MGIEGGSIGIGGGIGGVNVGVSVGPSINIGPAVSAGTEAGLSARFGPSIIGLSLPIVSEGPAGRSSLENTMPLQLGFNQVEEIKFNDKPFTGNTSEEPLLPQDAIKAVETAEDIIAQAQQPLKEKGVVAGAEATQTSTIVEMYGIRPEPFWIDEQPIVERSVGTQARLQSKTEDKVSVLEVSAVKTAPAVAIQPALQEQEAAVEELAEEQVTPEKPAESLEEEEAREKILYLEDVEVSEERRHEIREAVKKARIAAGRLGLKKIAGWLVAKFMPLEHAGNRSQVVKKTGPDGSYQETVEEIAGAGELESAAAAIKRFDKIVAEKKPVKYGKDGKPVGNQDVARVFKYRLFKPAQPYAEVIRRVVRKSISPARQSAGVNTIPPQGWTVVVQEEIKPEGSLGDYPALAEACLAGQKAAA